ncbi:DUF5681 domain-containing protein [Erythrobacter sp. sf7]|uniref:DUF5681 domain-containing protein n=1 Tax=Erythrobacter fulvus TaxID=2987523 RepID=A0ABT5JSA2_9SPHN|nr:DUF5681 domain-containing protein [Erythrobacter fulvus]MDC8755642.1 DUF5681 domain-containing protein [Erythrobacter fulvus]
MSQPDREEEHREPEQENNIVPYKVGYGKPPVEHRFQKGQSGNPKGRVKGSTNKPKVNTGHGMRAAEEYLRYEAYRPVTLREDGQLIELPAIQAVFRAMGVAAMKGNRFAQKTLAELVTGLEQRDADARFELMGNALDYKKSWSDEIERCEKLGLPVPEPIPHPDDIIIDPRNGGVRILGPQTKEEKTHYDKATARRIEAQEEVSYFADKYRKARSEKNRQLYLENWHWEQRMFDIINDAMPERYKMKLKDRSYREGVSRAGETTTEFFEDRKRPPEERKWRDYVGD